MTVEQDSSRKLNPSIAAQAEAYATGSVGFSLRLYDDRSTVRVIILLHRAS